MINPKVLLKLLTEAFPLVHGLGFRGEHRLTAPGGELVVDVWMPTRDHWSLYHVKLDDDDLQKDEATLIKEIEGLLKSNWKHVHKDKDETKR